MQNEFKKINKTVDNFTQFHEELKEKRAFVSRWEKLDELAKNIHRFLNFDKGVTKIQKQKEAIKINNKFNCIPKKLYKKFIEKYELPDNLYTIFTKAIYCFNGSKTRRS